MPMHDWSRVDPGIYHDFHQGWTIALRNALNRGLLPAGYVALTDLRVAGYEPDVVAVRADPPGGGTAVLDAPPAARLVARAVRDTTAYARKANRIIVRSGLGPVVAVIEIVSPGNKDSKHAVAAFVGKAVEFLTRGVSLALVDPFPPGPRDPDGLHRLIWDELPGDPFPPRPAGLPLTAAGFEAAADLTAYVDPFAVGDPVPASPLFLSAGRHVPLPLEAAYQAAWAETPAVLQALVEAGPRPPVQ